MQTQLNKYKYATVCIVVHVYRQVIVLFQRLYYKMPAVCKCKVGIMYEICAYTHMHIYIFYNIKKN